MINNPDYSSSSLVEGPTSSGDLVRKTPIVFVKEEELIGKMEFVWKIKSRNESHKKIPAKNIIHIRQETQKPVKDAVTPGECSSIFFSPDMIEIILIHTNEQSKMRRSGLQHKNNSTYSNLQIEELNDLFEV